MTFARSLDPDQHQQNISPDLDPNYFTLRKFFEKVNFEKKSADDNKNMKNYEVLQSNYRKMTIHGHFPIIHW